MDLTSRIKEFRGRQNNLRSWFLTSMLPQGVVLTGGNRLTLLLMGQLILRQSRPFSAITTEAEGLGTLKDLQPGLLVVASPLEEGDAISLCRKARQQQAKLSLPGHRCPGGCGAAPLDIGGDDYPLVSAQHLSGAAGSPS